MDSNIDLRRQQPEMGRSYNATVPPASNVISSSSLPGTQLFRDLQAQGTCEITSHHWIYSISIGESAEPQGRFGHDVSLQFQQRRPGGRAVLFNYERPLLDQATGPRLRRAVLLKTGFFKPLARRVIPDHLGKMHLA